ncbi:hypothetical protein N7478_008646 [Penicillium angulare]|uniref:uncharacterized protein n=1 Tax=Penicillium angulare TaxID=116970 RepID=UPI00253FB3F4|nr:uncharacterized protein N7478_008646 [Penicillium angulare]KAJ5273521.1 hypothetical protein N7478_008646 [Penicillium angulare]
MPFIAAWLFLIFGFFGLHVVLAEETRSSQPPTATLSNTDTIFVGRQLAQFDQDLFLGIKFADEPVRFTPSKLKTKYASNDRDSGAYNLSAAGFKPKPSAVYYNATEYGNDCPGYGSDTTELVDMGLIRLNEDCLNLNVIKPSTQSNELLPVLLWIFGGGWQQGATADPRSVNTSLR